MKRKNEWQKAEAKFLKEFQKNVRSYVKLADKQFSGYPQLMKAVNQARSQIGKDVKSSLYYDIDKDSVSTQSATKDDLNSLPVKMVEIMQKELSSRHARHITQNYNPNIQVAVKEHIMESINKVSDHVSDLIQSKKEASESEVKQGAETKSEVTSEKAGTASKKAKAMSWLKSKIDPREREAKQTQEQELKSSVEHKGGPS